MRVQDQAGRPLAGARFDGEPRGASGAEVSDSFGRLFRRLKEGEKLVGTVIKEGLQPARVSAQCPELIADDFELPVILHK